MQTLVAFAAYDNTGDCNFYSIYDYILLQRLYRSPSLVETIFRHLFEVDCPKGFRNSCILILGGSSLDDIFQIWISESVGEKLRDTPQMLQKN